MNKSSLNKMNIVKSNLLKQRIIYERCWERNGKLHFLCDHSFIWYLEEFEGKWNFSRGEKKLSTLSSHEYELIKNTKSRNLLPVYVINYSPSPIIQEFQDNWAIDLLQLDPRPFSPF